MSKILDTSENTSGADPELRQRVLLILGEVLQREFDPQTSNLLRSEAVGWDSVTHLRLALELEDAFEITLSDEQWVSVNSLDEIVALLSTLGVQGASTDK